LEYTLKEIARAVGGKIVGDGEQVITGINSLDAAGPGDMAFFADPRYVESLAQTKASAVLVSRETDLFQGPQVVVTDPVLGFAKVSGLFVSPVSSWSGVSSSAVIDPTSRIGNGAAVYPHVYVGMDAVVGDHAVLFPGVHIGDRVHIGQHSILYPNVSVLHDCVIGNDVVVHAGTVIGSDGFGFTRDGDSSVKIPQLGIVQIDDHAEIGANNCIDRATLGKTWVQQGAKTDNLVHIAHNVVIGENTIVVAQSGISGSVTVGRNVVIGGQVGISDHVRIGDGVMIGSQSGVAKDISSGQAVSGTPALPHRVNLRVWGLLKRLPEMSGTLRKLEKDLHELQKRLK
jgi:UDP-3-O-[3-hydroxymyristoyl] glucosamine N-acyltransferase